MSQVVVNIWKFSTSDITCLFSIRNYYWLKSFTRLSLFVITLFIFGCLGYARGQLTPTDLWILLISISDTINELSISYLKSSKSTELLLFQTTPLYSFRNILVSSVIRYLKWINLSTIMVVIFWELWMFDQIFLSTQVTRSMIITNKDGM